jgi:hypothetical protein
VGITQARKPHDKATKQIGHQQTATNIDRSINPLGEKPLTKKNIDILSKKPEIYEKGEGDYIKKITRAQATNSAVIFAKGRRGAVRRVDKLKQRKPTKKNRLKYTIKTAPIASYIKGGEVKLTKKRPFFNEAVLKAMKDVNDIFIKKAEWQIKRVQAKKL